MEEKLYRITWSIEVSAPNALAAIKIAANEMPHSTASEDLDSAEFKVDELNQDNGKVIATATIDVRDAGMNPFDKEDVAEFKDEDIF